MTRELIDCHVHTYLSGHGKGSAIDMAASGSSQGLSTMAFTEHLILPEGWDPEHHVSLSEAGLVQYREDVERAREEHPDMEILYGAEVDWLDDAGFILDHIAGFEYLLGSVHYIDGWAYDNPDNLSQWEDVDVDALWLRYAEIWESAVKSDIPFSTMSHPDLPKKFGYRPSFDPREMYAEMARTAAKKGVAVEVNTSGWRNPAAEQYPSLELLRAFFSAGIDCTIGSDAHKPSDVGSSVKRAMGIMYEAGYRRVMVPTRTGDRRYLDISAVSL